MKVTFSHLKVYYSNFFLDFSLNMNLSIAYVIFAMTYLFCIKKNNDFTG